MAAMGEALLTAAGDLGQRRVPLELARLQDRLFRVRVDVRQGIVQDKHGRVFPVYVRVRGIPLGGSDGCALEIAPALFRKARTLRVSQRSNEQFR